MYASDKESLFQYDLDGELIKSINSNSCDSIYALIDGIYASEECVFCKLGGSPYLLVDPNSLETIIINDILENGEWETIENVQIACGGDIRMASLVVQNGYTLRQYGIDFLYKRTRNGRLIILHYDRERDSSDSKTSGEVTVNSLALKV